MNREIKFRVWDKNRNKMWYHGDWLNDTYDKEYFSTVPSCLFEILEDLKNEKYGYSLQQFTGLKDKNGKEIYEGDILEYFIDQQYQNCGTYICEIVFSNGSFFSKNDYDFGSRMYGDRIRLQPCLSDGYIIGNIFENPELLKSV